MYDEAPPRGKAAAIRVFLVAGHAALRDNVALLLAGERIAVCGWAPGAAAALAGLPAETDAVLIGLAADQAEALALVRALAERPGAPPALVLSADDDDDSIRRALAAGAAGYVASRRAGEVLAQAIREVAAGRLWAPRPETKEDTGDLR